MKKTILLIVLILFSPGVEKLFNIGIRHDRKEALYTAFAEQFPEVCQVAGFASGVLIADDWVLTAAHVADFFDFIAPDPSSRSVMIEGKTYNIDRVVVYPDHQKLTPELLAAPDKDKNFNLHDIALLHLREPVKGVEPAHIYRGTGETGSEFCIAGYGALFNEPQSGIEPDRAASLPQGIKRAGMNVYDREGDKEWTLEATFNAPGDGAMDLEAFPFAGDSGGPLFTRNGNEWQVSGICSFMESDSDMIGQYGSRFSAARVSKYALWIDGIVK